MRRGGSALLALLLTAACEREAGPESGVVDRWLLCEECTDGELDSVLALGDRAVPLLEKALEGPSPERQAYMRSQIENTYALIRDTSGISRDRYLDRFSRNHIAGYQIRAALALGRLNTEDTRRILREALRRDDRFEPDVRRELGTAVGAVLSIVAGDAQHAPHGEFVRESPAVVVRSAVTGEVLSGVQVRFYVDSGRGIVSDSVGSTNQQGRATVRWRMGNDSANSLNVLRVVAAGRVLRIRAQAHSPGLRVVILNPPRGGRAGRPIVPPVHIAVQDAWGATQTSLNQPVAVSIPGAHFVSMHNLVGGRAQLAGLSVPIPGTDFTLTVKTDSAATAISPPFDIVP